MSNHIKTIESKNNRPEWSWDDELLRQSIQEQPNGCAIWIGKFHSSAENGATNRPFFKAYVRSNRLSTVNPQRIVYAKHYNITLYSTEQIYTRCGNRNCMNPEHLFIGSRDDARVKQQAFNITKYSSKWIIENLELILGCRSKKKMMEMFCLTSNQAHYIRQKAKRSTNYQLIDLRERNGLSENIQQPDD